ncbi:hypothetical protein [Sinorhizobium meliloti]|uniref:hypothetical protein n=1 Tax=Rhizobium meliloti TaxID=382 RepID=UPI0001E4B02E|nr:hypothetical protein [Sinorhizobium meliloti]AEG53172.1 hypothetical protein Sinme_1427 [Sinorhizobium meliloti AK83]MDE4591112.1 hypothetical protein [Sinorhizobium meliloti]SEI56516.1 hypothetical protein SAMN04244575_01076 [Sinorhizobium meliloti]
MAEVYVVTGSGQRYVGDLESVKEAIESTVKSMVAYGSGLVIIDASPELTDFLIDLQIRYPWKGLIEWELPDLESRKKGNL